MSLQELVLPPAPLRLKYLFGGGSPEGLESGRGEGIVEVTPERTFRPSY